MEALRTNLLRKLALLGISAMAAACLATAVAPALGQPDGAAGFSAGQGAAFVGANCVMCHSKAQHTAGVVLEGQATLPIGPNADLWERVVKKLNAGEMPPPSVKRRPDPVQLAAFVHWLTLSLNSYAGANPDPGAPVLRRLTRAEYSNAIRDLLAIDIDPGADLPADTIAFSFNNNGDALSMSPLLMEKYLHAARQVSRLAVGDPSLPKATYSFDGPDRQSGWSEGVPFGARSGPVAKHFFPATGDYVVRVLLGNSHSPDVPGRRLFEARTRITAGEHTVAAMVADEGALPEGPVPQISGGGQASAQGSGGPMGGPLDPLDSAHQPQLLDLRLDDKRFHRFEVGAPTLEELRAPNSLIPGSPFIRVMEIDGPYDPAGVGPTPSQARIFVCRPRKMDEEASCAGRILTAIVRRAYRRDISEHDVAPFLALYRQARLQGDFKSGIQQAIQGILVSPNFLFRLERGPVNGAAEKIYRISDFELATRLSFLIWSSIPDDHLLALAHAGQLHRPDVLHREVRRMLADAKAAALVDNFGMQYLGLQDAQNAVPDATAYPDFDTTLRRQFLEESRLFLTDILLKNQSILDLVGANYTYLNEDLARHYGVPGVSGAQFRKVAFDAGAVRGGVLGQGSVLLATSHTNITSPVLRGKWVLTNLFNQPPSPPPPGVPAIQATNAAGRPLTGREQMEQHRKAPLCSSCHARMEPFGFSMENLDVTGRWRVNDEGGKVDPVVTMPDGSGFTGVPGLKQKLLGNPDLLAQAFAGRLMTYALGRRLEAPDRPVVRAIAARAAAHGYRFDDFLLQLVDTSQFLMRRKDGQS